MIVLDVKQVSKAYGEGENQVRALKQVDFQMEQGEFVALLGASGSGKSTLLNVIGGLDTVTEGNIMIRGQNIAKLRQKELTIFRRRNIGFIFQDYSLMPVLNVYDNVALPVSLDKGRHIDHPYIERLLKDLKIWDKRTRFPKELSGGQQQRVAIARALANKPALVLADEPTGNLDSRTTNDVIGLLKASGKQYNQTILMVTHNEIIAQSCDRIVRIEDGVLSGSREGGEDHA
ncbi:MAG: ABC transporter ATP-binding protein [Firmicutes bacterium]|nr:ABC transporter ATP-binding protein [Bacillota bacterium]NBI63982.1 ABC transporter ATP-binding protein [Clostridiales bacterium]